MTLRIRYTEAAFERIRSLGEKDLIKFISDLPERTVSPLLPPIDGFRKNSNRGLDVRKKTFAKFLLNGAGAASDKSQRAQGALVDIWKQWAREHISDKALLDAHFDKLDEYARSSENIGDQPQVFPPQLADDLFSALRDLSSANKCSREDVARFFQFSPFEETAEIKQAIEHTKLASQIEEEGEFAALPKRLKADEASIQQLQKKLADTQSQLTKAIAEQRELRKDISGLRPLLAEAGGLTELRTLQAKLSKNFERIEKETGQRRDADAAARKNVSQRLEKIERGEDAQKLANVIQDLADRLAVVERSQEVQKLASAIREVEDSAAKFTAAIEARLAEVKSESDTHLTAMEEQLKSLPSDLNVKLEALSNELQELGQKASTTVFGTGPAQSSNQLVLQKLARPPDAALTTLASQQSICASLSKSLQGLGLKKTSSEALSEEIVAACLSRQPVSFRGAMALSVARACAATLAAESSFRVSVPLGLGDPELLSKTFRSVRMGDFSGIAAIVVEGGNRASFDISAGPIADVVRGDHWSRATGSILVFCALANGLGALPVEPEHFELGPVLDMNCLEWKRRLRTETREQVWGRLGKGVWKTLEAQSNQQAVDADEALAMLKKVSPPPNGEIENNVFCAFRALAMLRKSAERSLLQSIAFGWIAPYWQALGVSHDVADGELDSGNVDNPQHPDERLARLLKSGAFEAGDADIRQ